MDFLTNYYNKQKESKMIQSECMKDISIQLNILFGYNEIGGFPYSTMRQNKDGLIYFDFKRDNTYKLIGYEWKGALYDTIVTTNSQSNNNSNTVKKGKSGRMATGAIIGTMLLPGVGTAVGAAIGAGGKSKSKTYGNSNTNTIQSSKEVEKDSTAILKLQKISDNSIVSISIKCNSSIDSKIRCLNIEQSQTVQEISRDSVDSLKAVKALKELLDMGAITQEEFDRKKNELLKL